MFYMLSDDELEKIFKASSITMTEYDLLGKFMPAGNFMNIIEDLLIEIDKLEEEIETIEKDRDENYKRIPVAEQYEVYNREFI